ncbi:MAG: hypothetical protein ACI8WB_003227 [Phenylobacterium sp.]
MLLSIAFLFIAALVCIDIIPKLIDSSGPAIILIMLFGLAVPTLVEKVFKKTSEVHKIAVLTGVVGLVIHTLADGAALALYQVEQNLALSVAIHRVPIGLFVWWFVKPHFGTIAAYGMLGIIAVSTVLGFTFADTLLPPFRLTRLLISKHLWLVP